MMGNTQSYIVRGKSVNKVTAALEKYPYRKNIDIQLSEMSSRQEIVAYSSSQPLTGQHGGVSDASLSANLDGTPTVLDGRQDWSIAGGWWDKHGIRCALCNPEYYACADCAGNGDDW
jgi:hypothetical protein